MSSNGSLSLFDWQLLDLGGALAGIALNVIGSPSDPPLADRDVPILQLFLRRSYLTNTRLPKHTS